MNLSYVQIGRPVARFVRRMEFVIGVPKLGYDFCLWFREDSFVRTCDLRSVDPLLDLAAGRRHGGSSHAHFSSVFRSDRNNPRFPPAPIGMPKTTGGGRGSATPEAAEFVTVYDIFKINRLIINKLPTGCN